MIPFLVCVTILFFSKAMMGLSRLMDPPKRMVMYYNHKADMVEMILNWLVLVWGASLSVAHFAGIQGV